MDASMITVESLIADLNEIVDECDTGPLEQ